MKIKGSSMNQIGQGLIAHSPPPIGTDIWSLACPGFHEVKLGYRYFAQGCLYTSKATTYFSIFQAGPSIFVNTK
jgi:hypothetical protein